MAYFVQQHVLNLGVKIAFVEAEGFDNQSDPEHWEAARDERLAALVERWRGADLHADAVLEGFNVLHDHAHGRRKHNVPAPTTLIPKRRYDFMNAYFAHIGTDGDHMMRASASTQVSVDYADEADAVRKMRVASALAPVLAAIADNTVVYEAEPNHIPIRRLQLWREVDNLRCGTVPDVFGEGFGFEAYADWLLRTPPIFITRAPADTPGGTRLRPFFSTPASEAYADAPMARTDVEHLISMFWPDVRLKHFVEVRPADSIPEDCVLGYTALVKGIFYSDVSLRAIERALGVDPSTAVTRGAWPISKEDVDLAIQQAQAHGLAGKVFGRPLSSWETLLFRLASDALDQDERQYLKSLEAFAADKPWWHVTPAG